MKFKSKYIRIQSNIQNKISNYLECDLNLETEIYYEQIYFVEDIRMAIKWINIDSREICHNEYSSIRIRISQ